MAKKGRSAASRRQAARRVSANNSQHSAAVPRVPRPERTQLATVENKAPKSTAPRVDSSRMGKVVAGPSSKAKDASIQYPYVLGDLKQLGIIAAAMFAVLIILSLIIR